MIGIKETVIIQRPDFVDDEYGTGSNTWTNVAELNATIAAVSAHELLLMDRAQMRWTHKMWLDYHKARTLEGEILPGGRVKVGELVYNIVGIENHMRRLTVVKLELTT